jgi:hypothetical protein
MRTTKVVMMTTHRDAHGDQLDGQTLREFAEQIKTAYLPLWTHHDPRIPPHGRVVDAYVERHPDDELALIGVVEEFESGPRPPLDTARAMKIDKLPVDLLISVDRTYRDKQSQALLSDLASILHVPIRPESKKALEPLSVLTLAATAVLGGIAGGFAARFGEDIYEQVKKKLALLFARRREKSDDFVFRYRAEIVVGGRIVEVDFLATAPSEAQIDRIFKTHLAIADAKLMSYLPAHPDVRRVVFDASAAELKFSYAIRADVYPIFDEPSRGA